MVGEGVGAYASGGGERMECGSWGIEERVAG